MSGKKTDMEPVSGRALHSSSLYGFKRPLSGRNDERHKPPKTGEIAR